ncbi:MAG: hypothetical protein WAW80_04275 [Candidatus Saccharimonadales bacterium]
MSDTEKEKRPPFPGENRVPRQSAQEPDENRRSWWIVGGVLFILVALIAGVIILAFSVMQDGNYVEADGQETTTITTTVSDPSQVPNNAECGGFTVKLLEHPGGNFSPKPLTANSPDTAKKEILDQNKYEPSSLYGYYLVSPIYGKYPEVKSERDLVKDWTIGSCYSDVGKKVYEDWAWAWQHAVLTPVDHMPTAGTVMGATQTGQVFQQSGRINDSYGYEVKYPGYGDQYNHGARGLCTQPYKGGVSNIPGALPPPPNAPPLTYVTDVSPPPVVVPPPGGCEGPGCFPVEQCPPSAPLPYPDCFPVTPPPPPPPPPPPSPPPPLVKDYRNGPAQVVTIPQRPNPLPVTPKFEEPSVPNVPSPTAQYTPPSQAPVVVVSQNQGGPTPIPSDTPRTTQPKVAEAPKASTVTSTNSSGATVTTQQGSTTDLSGMG